jgi:hypothetical protein
VVEGKIRIVRLGALSREQIALIAGDLLEPEVIDGSDDPQEGKH